MKKTHIHFMGIGGSAISGIALIAKNMGYRVSGCDLTGETAYTNFLKKDGIPILVGHDADHLEGVDILAVTPSVFFLNNNHPEVELAKEKKILMTWQELTGKVLQKGKKVICVAGTHGKSTTTAMAGYLLEKASFDPIVVIGAKVNKWGGSFRAGKGKYFVTEADEFYDNFLNYKSDIIILNNIEFDHPDYFKSYEDILTSFKKFLRNLREERVLIFNQDSKGIKELFDILGPGFLTKIKSVGYSLNGKMIKRNTQGTSFRVNGEEFKLNVFGDHNVSNALGVIALGKFLKIPVKTIKESLADFEGVGRRLELVGTKKGIAVYDDYAHHPTAIAATLEALRQKYPESFIWAINEPHMYSRTKALLGKYKGVFDKADRVTIAPIYMSRDKSTFGISPESIVKSSGHTNIEGSNSFDDIVRAVKKDSKSGDVILVMGAGDSYLLAQNIYEAL